MAFIKQEFVDGVTVVTAAWLNGIQEVVGANAVAPEYSSEQTYSIGTLAAHDGQLYQCNTTIATPEEWTSAHWTATSLEALLNGLDITSVFWCTYGTTTYAEISQALSDGKVPICPYDFTSNSVEYKGVARYSYTSESSHQFYDTSYGDSWKCVSIQALSSDAWMEDVVNPVNGIFWVTVGTTSNPEITEAISHGLWPVIKDSSNGWIPYTHGMRINGTGGNYTITSFFSGVSRTGDILTASCNYSSRTGNTTWNSATEKKVVWQNNVATIQSSKTASRAYAVGDYFFFGNIFYVVTQDIAQGGAIVIGTNCTQVMLADELSSLRADAITNAQIDAMYGS